MAEDTKMQEVFRGHLDECLKHFAERFDRAMPKGRRGSALAKKPIADFCDVTVDTVARWLDGSGGLRPEGETSLRLMCFLDMHGYRVIELERMSKPHRKFAELIGYGLITAQQATELIGYANSNGMYRLLKDESEPKDKEEKVWQIWKERKEALEAQKRSSWEHFHLTFLDTKQEQVKVVEPANVQTHGCWQKAAHGMMSSLLILFDEGLLDNLSDEELVILHKIAGSTILRLSAHLSALSSRLFSNQSKGR